MAVSKDMAGQTAWTSAKDAVGSEKESTMSRVLYILLFVAVVLSECNKVMAAESFEDLDRDEKIVAVTILAEAKGEGSLGMRAVACVIQQRSIERKKSPAAICLQPRQFSCWNGTSLATLSNRVTRKVAPEVLNVATSLAKDLVVKKDLGRGLVKFANHYHTKDVRPAWSVGEIPVVILGNHKFFKL